MLDHLLEEGVVARFLRISGWVTIGVDQVRSCDPSPKEMLPLIDKPLAQYVWNYFISHRLT
jgi:hypothetical protein